MLRCCLSEGSYKIPRDWYRAETGTRWFQDNAGNIIARRQGFAHQLLVAGLNEHDVFDDSVENTGDRTFGITTLRTERDDPANRENGR